MTKLTRIAKQLSGAAGLMSALALAASTATAQDSGIDPRWQAWLGCWEAVDPEGNPATLGTPGPRVCVIPAAGTSAVEIVTLVGDSIALRQRIAATGEQVAGSKDGCTGWDRAQWSSGAQRVFLRSSYTCPGGLTRLSNGVMAMSPTGEWLDVLGVIAGTTQGVRVARYRDVTNAASLPAEIATALRGRVPAVNDARTVAMAPLTTEDVLEASRFIDPGVVQTWLAERGEGFTLDAKKLAELEKAGLPTAVIDVMVALSYPRVFALDRSRVVGATRETAEAAPEGRTVYVYGWDPFYSPYGSRYGYGYPYGYGYGGYGGWYYGTRPIVIVRQPPSGGSETERHGRVVKGRGYVPGSSPVRRSEGSAGSRGSSSGSSGAASGSSGSSSSGSSSKSPSSGSGRTAKPRPPG